jgi:hypothetical protein
MTMRPIALALVLLGTATTHAQVPPKLIPYNGHLDRDGVPVNGTVAVTFFLVTSEGAAFGANVWAEDHAAVVVANGRFSVLLGGTTPIPDGVLRLPALYLGMKVGETLGGAVELSGRQRLGSAAGAVTAAQAEDFTVNGDVSAASFSFATPQQRYMMFPGSTFLISHAVGDDIYAGGGPGYLYPIRADAGGDSRISDDVRVAVHLPDGATVTSFRCYLLDQAGLISVSAVLRAHDIANTGATGATTSMASVSLSSTGSSAVLQPTPEDVTINSPIINNQRYGYLIQASLSADVVGTTLAFYGCRIGYLVSSL